MPRIPKNPTDKRVLKSRIRQLEQENIELKQRIYELCVVIEDISNLTRKI